MVATSTKNYYIVLGLLYLFRLWIQFLSANFFTVAILTCISFLFVININLYHGNVAFLFSPEFSNFIKILGISGKNTQSFDQTMIFGVIGRISFILFIISRVFEVIIKIITGKQILIKNFYIYLGIAIITVIFVAALVSVFAPQAAIDSGVLIPVLIIFWIIALINFLIGTGLGFLANKLQNVTVARPDFHE